MCVFVFDQRDLKKEREKKKIVSQTKREEGPRDC